MLAKTLLTLILITNIFARYTIADRELQAADLAEAHRLYGEIEHRIRTESFNAIRAEMDAQRTEIAAPFRAQMEAMDARITPLTNALTGIERAKSILREEQHRMLHAIDAQQEQALHEHEARFSAEITRRLAPDQAELDTLAREERTVNDSYNNFRAQHPRVCDEHDESDWGRRLTTIERRRKEIMDSRCGDIFSEKTAARAAIKEQFAALKAERSAAHQTANAEIEKEIEGVKVAVETLVRERSAIHEVMNTEVCRIFAERGMEKTLIELLTRDTTELLPNFFGELIRRNDAAAAAAS